MPCTSVSTKSKKWNGSHWNRCHIQSHHHQPCPIHSVCWWSYTAILKKHYSFFKPFCQQMNWKSFSRFSYGFETVFSTDKLKSVYLFRWFGDHFWRFLAWFLHASTFQHWILYPHFHFFFYHILLIGALVKHGKGNIYHLDGCKIINIFNPCGIAFLKFSAGMFKHEDIKQGTFESKISRISNKIEVKEKPQSERKVEVKERKALLKVISYHILFLWSAMGTPLDNCPGVYPRQTIKTRYDGWLGNQNQGGSLIPIFSWSEKMGISVHLCWPKTARNPD